MKILAEYCITLLRKWQRWLVVGDRAGKVQTLETLIPAPCRRPGPCAGDAPTAQAAAAHSKRTQAPPFAAGGLSSRRSKAMRSRRPAKRRKVSADAGRGPGEGRAHLSERNEGRGFEYLGRK